MTNLATKSPIQTGLFSADSHVVEPVTAWEGVLPPSFWPKEGSTAGRWGEKGGGFDPERRSAEMAADGVIAEVLYPSRGLSVFGVEDVATHEAACHAYNTWLIDYCSVAPERLLGVGMIPVYDCDKAVEEIRFCQQAGFRGVMIWQVPHPDLPFRGRHYEPIFSELERLNLPLSFHILTGFWRKYSVHVTGVQTVTPESARAENSPLYRYETFQRAVNFRLQAAMDLLLSFIMTGVFDRHPKLRITFVENEIGWFPFASTQYDAYYNKKLIGENGEEILGFSSAKLPSAYFGSQVFATFFQDAMSRMLFESYGSDMFMWSNDYPHPNSTWPNSREWIGRNIGDLSHETLEKVLRTNAEGLYGIVPDLAE